VSIVKPTTIKMKLTKRQETAEPLSNVSENIKHPKRKIKKPRKSLL
jgi:hypothetical protein